MSTDAHDPQPHSAFVPPTPPPSFAGVTAALTGTQPWARVMGFVFYGTVGFMVLAGLVVGGIGLATGEAGAAILLVGYPLMAVLYVPPAMYLLRYANRIRDYAGQGQMAQLEAALDAQRAFWKYSGILTLIAIGLTLLLVAVAIVLGVIGLAMAR